jgi:vesicular inhibitory amino acid transporter
MAAEQGDRFSFIEVPLLDDEKVYQVNGSKTKDEHHTVHEGNTSLFKTCFHLVNGISGSNFLPSLSYCLLLIINNHSYLCLWSLL